MIFQGKAMTSCARGQRSHRKKLHFHPPMPNRKTRTVIYQSFRSPWVGAVPPTFSSFLPFLPSFSLTALAAKSESTASTSTPSSLKSEECAATGTTSTPSSLRSEAAAAAESSGFSTVSQSSGVWSWAVTDS